MPNFATEKTQALILRSVDFGESDRILHLLVPGSGRLTAIAKGARRSVKRFGGTLDLFNHLRVQVTRRRGAAMHRLEQTQLVHYYDPLRRDPARFAIGCYLLELLDRLAPEGGSGRDMQRLFAFALDALDALSRHRPDGALRTMLELRALDALGLRPELRRCVACGQSLRDPKVGFHVADGGPVCAGCGASRSGLLSLHLGTLRALEQGLALDSAQLDRLVLTGPALVEARRLLARFQRYHVGVELQSQRFLDRMLPDAGTRAAGPV